MKLLTNMMHDFCLSLMASDCYYYLSPRQSSVRSKRFRASISRKLGQKQKQNKKKKERTGDWEGQKETPAHMFLSPPVKEKSCTSSSHDAAHTSLEATFSFLETAILVVSSIESSRFHSHSHSQRTRQIKVARNYFCACWLYIHTFIRSYIPGSSKTKL